VLYYVADEPLSRLSVLFRKHTTVFRLLSFVLFIVVTGTLLRLRCGRVWAENSWR